MAGRQAGNVERGGPFTGPAMGAGFKTCWPEVAALWRHESGAILTLQSIGRAYALTWRARAHWAAWPFDPLIFDEGDAETNRRDAMEQAEALLQFGPPDKVLDAKESARERARVRANAAYQKKKEARGPSSHDVNKLIRVGLAKMLKLKPEDAGLTESDMEPAEKKTGRPRLPTRAETSAAKEDGKSKMIRLRTLLRPALEDAGFSGDEIAHYLADSNPATVLKITKWLMREDTGGRAALLAAQKESNAMQESQS